MTATEGTKMTVRSKFSDQVLVQRIRYFCDCLDEVGAGRSVNMMQEAIQEPSCGTPGCHAGWAYIALGGWACQERRLFQDGIEVLSKFLGFDYNHNDLTAYCQLAEWATPQIWGNDIGRHMFSSPSAFLFLKCPFPVEVISSHWRKVADRVESMSQTRSVLWSTGD